MNRRERRRRARERKKIEEKLKKEASQPRTGRTESPTRLRRVLEAFQKTVSGTRVLLSLLLAVLAWISSYALFHPHVSIEPDILLNPANPFSTQFKITNESVMLAVRDLTSHCWTQSLSTSHNLSIWDPSGASARQVQHKTAFLGPKNSDTIDCAAVIMGGIGTYTGNLTFGNIIVSISYKQDWWPFAQTEYYPFSAMQDSQGISHWMHVTSFKKPPFLK
jgi:hypothetical protein